MSNVEISVVIPIYKVERYVAKTIESVQHQDFDSYEIILVDDGSPDNSGKICDQYATSDSRIKVIHKENGGVMSARFAGVDAAEGKYIAFLDGDDRMPPTALSNFYKAMKEKEVDYVNGVCVDIDENGNRINDVIYGTSFNGILEGNEKYRRFISEHPKGLNMKMWRKDVLLSEPRVVVHPSIKNNEDFIFNLLMSSRINSIKSIDDVVAEIVCHPGSASNGNYSLDYWINLLSWLDANYEKYDVRFNDLIQYKLFTIHEKIEKPLIDFDSNAQCFANIALKHYNARYGLRGLRTILYVRFSNNFIRALIRNAKSIIKKARGLFK